MASTRLFVNDTLGSGTELRLGREQAHYLGRVLRLHNGDSLTVFNGDNGEFVARVVSLGKNDAVVQIEAALEVETESPLKIHLVQGISRGERMDFVVQKATELGVKRITPVVQGEYAQSITIVKTPVVTQLAIVSSNISDTT